MLINTIDQDMGILSKYHLNPNELFVIRILILAQEEDDSYLYKYLSIPEEDRGDFREILLELQRKGVILKSYRIRSKGEDFDPHGIDLNKNFLKFFHRESYEMGAELWTEYPDFCTINGDVVAIKSVSKKFNSKEDMFRMYGKLINWNPETHAKIMELLKWAKENTQFIQFTLASFVIDRRWDELEALRDGGLANVNFNAVKML